MSKLALPIPTELCNALRYEDGRLYWRHNGEEWGTQRKAGYRRGRFQGRWYRRGRVVWAVCNGGHIDRGMQIDHLNHVRDDDRIENLRLVSQQENSVNRKHYVTNTSGVMGVDWNKCSWRVRLGRRDGGVYVGRFANFEDAVSARNAALLKHKYHKNHGG